ncbi:DUF6880 family protein [Neorhizobium sp. BT27B]|uniref:DUF6880 family protein n=1 Tax=Neorhizobium sp. BT27B TaxID=3142625 RepID=UPI003D2CE474
MATKTTLNAKNLETLGAPRLAELLIEIATGNAAHKRRLRLELAGDHSSAEVARAVRKRLGSIARARTFIDWKKIKATRLDLETQRRMIVETVATDDASEGYELIWQFLNLADSIFSRSNDSSGSLMQIFHQGCVDAGVVAARAAIASDVLAEKIIKAIQGNNYGQFDPLIGVMADALGHEGMERLKTLLLEWSNEPQETPSEMERDILGWSGAGPLYEDEVFGRHRDRTIRYALQEIADQQNDVDAYIALQPQETCAAPMVAADIANRLTAAGRAAEALDILDRVDDRGRGSLPFEWQIARIDALEALKRPNDAQAFRWQCFEQSLNEEHLRAYVRRLPDFDDLEAEEKAFDYVRNFPEVHQALSFFMRWPSPADAAKLVMKRVGELDGDFYELMNDAADMLGEKHPLAAMMVLRAMIDFTLENGRSSRYKHAARHLTECLSLASQIEDYSGIEAHEDYVARLMREHGRKSGFWNQAT